MNSDHGRPPMRELIRIFRKQVRLKMQETPNGNVTPWGVWKTIKPGLYRMESTLDNRFIDTELSTPFLTEKEFKEIYPTMESGYGITIQRSLVARAKMRKIARQILEEYCKMDTTNNGIVKILGVSKRSLHKLSIFRNSVVEELAHELNSYGSVNNKLIPVAKSKYIASMQAVRPIDAEHGVEVKFLTNDLIATNPAEIHQQSIIPHGITTILYQRIFIDLATLATLQNSIMYSKLSFNMSLRKLNALILGWKFFTTKAYCCGIPAAMVSTHGHFDPGPHKLSPTNAVHDPITAVMYGMWANWFMDDFSITLSLDHPDPKQRGAYLSFRLGGKARNIESFSKLNMLNHPIYGQGEPMEDTKDIIGKFEQGINQGKDSVLF